MILSKGFFRKPAGELEYGVKSSSGVAGKIEKLVRNSSNHLHWAF